MILSLQDRVFEAMGCPEIYPDPPRSVVCRETHISRVFIAGQRVYKIKKALNLGFLDYADLPSREYFCREEVRLNRRLSRGVYLGVVPITRNAERIAIDGPGEMIEAAVCMRRLSESRCLLRLLRAGRLTADHIDDLTRVLCAFFDQPLTEPGLAVFGEPAGIRQNCEENFDQLAPFAGSFLDAAGLSRIREGVLAYLIRRRPLFERRLATGRIREGHGDLRTGHIYFDEGVQIIDCIEFDARYRCADVAADLAFLVMDLEAEGFGWLSRRIAAAVAEGIKDPGMLALLPFYQNYRALVRVKVACLQQAQMAHRRSARARCRRTADRLMALAAGYGGLTDRQQWWVVCGLPGSGKSTLAGALGRELALPVLRSDAIRKEMAGMAPEASAVSSVDEGIYGAQMTAATYRRLMECAETAAQSAGGVILDATFSDAGQREMAARAAAAHGAALNFIQCSAPPEVLLRRLAARGGRPSVSDARPEHLPSIMQRFSPFCPDPGTDHTFLDTTRPMAANLIEAMSARFLRDQTRAGA